MRQAWASRRVRGPLVQSGIDLLALGGHKRQGRGAAQHRRRSAGPVPEQGGGQQKGSGRAHTPRRLTPAQGQRRVRGEQEGPQVPDLSQLRQVVHPQVGAAQPGQFAAQPAQLTGQFGSPAPAALNLRLVFLLTENHVARQHPPFQTGLADLGHHPLGRLLAEQVLQLLGSQGGQIQPQRRRGGRPRGRSRGLEQRSRHGRAVYQAHSSDHHVVKKCTPRCGFTSPSANAPGILAS